MDIFLSLQDWARAAGKVIEGRARLVVEAPKVVEGPRSPLPVRELEVALLKKRESPGWGLRGFHRGEAGRGVSTAALLRLGFEGGPEWGWPPIKEAYRILTNVGGT